MRSYSGYCMRFTKRMAFGRGVAGRGRPALHYLCLCRRFFRLGNRAEETEEVFHSRNFQSVMDSLIHAH
jgi:hypothetical protein